MRRYEMQNLRDMRNEINVFTKFSKCSPILGLVFVENKHFDSLEKKARNRYQYLK